MDEFRWSDLEEEAKESLDELLANIRSNITRESHEYPDDSGDRYQLEKEQFDRADEWVRLVWQTYCDTLARLGREYSDIPPLTWSTEILEFIDREIEPLLESAMGVTEKEREFLRRGGITVQRLNRINEHPLDKSTPWLKVQAAQYVTERLKGRWKRGLSPTSVEESSKAPLIGPETQNLAKIADIGQSKYDIVQRFLDNSSPTYSVSAMMDFQRVQAEQQLVQDEEHGRKMDFYYKELNRARELAHARELANIQQASVHSKTPNAESDGPQADSGTRRKGKRDYNSPWKRALRQALLVLEKDAPYQTIANWIAENVPELDLPGYCIRVLKKDERGDIGVLYRTNKAVRVQFSKDVAKIKTDLKD